MAKTTLPDEDATIELVEAEPFGKQEDDNRRTFEVIAPSDLPRGFRSTVITTSNEEVVVLVPEGGSTRSQPFQGTEARPLVGHWSDSEFNCSPQYEGTCWCCLASHVLQFGRMRFHLRKARHERLRSPRQSGRDERVFSVRESIHGADHDDRVHCASLLSQCRDGSLHFGHCRCCSRGRAKKKVQDSGQFAVRCLFQHLL